jgi:large subunit ribosomal protein L24
MKIKKGDQVEIIAGKDKGKKGKVLSALPKDLKVIVEGNNIVKKAQKAKRYGQKGQLVEVPAPIHVSSVKVICPQCSKATRIGYVRNADQKERVCKKCEAKF